MSSHDWSRDLSLGRDAPEDGIGRETSDVPTHDIEEDWDEGMMHGYMPKTDSPAEDRDYENPGRRDHSMSPYISSIHSHGTKSRVHHPQIMDGNARGEHSGSANQPARQDARPLMEQDGQQRANPTLSMVHDLLSQVLHRAASGPGNGATPPPDFLKIVTTMKTLGTYHFGGEPDPYQADSWL
ncbi:unnamed protein product [Microthlaspi erraticum]|uniref:Uncharacterized protein n=1 Tax=Microthlaspi erraticum TaxID=1685480 RepID=A0A6D2J438_9BRAS|nr:unnamed protein product [Microthlaspi erraticum]CAA7045030.1 unnamed protein product [Microthlaspi erraticum]